MTYAPTKTEIVNFLRDHPDWQRADAIAEIVHLRTVILPAADAALAVSA